MLVSLSVMVGSEPFPTCSYFSFDLGFGHCFVLFCFLREGLSPWLKACSGQHAEDHDYCRNQGLNGRACGVDRKVTLSSGSRLLFCSLVQSQNVNKAHPQAPTTTELSHAFTRVDYTLTFHAKIKLSPLKLLLSGVLVRDENIKTLTIYK